MSKKILILTASPARDKVVDDMIAEELRAQDCEVWVHPCLREGRDRTLELMPDVVVVPPIRNPYSRDLVETIKDWGCGVVSRHTEASCDWQDFKKLTQAEKTDILGRWPYYADIEIVWGKDEQEILTRRGCKFPVVSVGSFVADVYKKDDIASRFMSRQEWNEKYKFSKTKKTLLIGSPWGFEDSAPDLQIDEMRAARDEAKQQQVHISMIEYVQEMLGDKWNIMVRPHPGVITGPYKKALEGMGIPIENECPCTEALLNSDALIHSGSTMAMEMHWLNKPAFQFMDYNKKDATNWWLKPDSPMSKISPFYNNATDLVAVIGKSRRVSNANKKTIKYLEKGRYGKMDGGAAKRAADLIMKVNGKFKYTWPKAHRDYDQLMIFKGMERIIQPAYCGVCKSQFMTVKPGWVKQLITSLRLPDKMKKNGILPPPNTNCPHCAARYFAPDEKEKV